MPLGIVFADRYDVQEYIDRMADESWFGEYFPDIAFIEVGASSASSGSCGTSESGGRSGYIELHDAQLSEGYVLHELAHVLARERFGSESHDPGFARMYCELVYRKIGTEAWLKLREAFIRHDIDFNASD